MPYHPVQLRPTASEDLEFVLEAENAAENACFIRQWSRDRHLQACQHPDERHWVVVDIVTQKRVGYVIMQGVQDVDQCLLLKRIVITEKGKGYGRSVLRQVLEKAFLDFNGHRIWLDVMERNERARSLYRNLGFVEEGRLRDAVKTSDGFTAMWLMSMLRSEFIDLYGSE
ncbi:GNAT family protein [Oscillatoria sp. CS-180]|uniref:GNAT family N-acetyltransferase n=1 Tax=Oscillatoria sp. CS-180 TaxID=3021720 RepID=UPI00232B2A23|nr:GNAT family protein [Oscillatoria sp. CS-180]MDB9528831.1 GNAT family protein [Oscillatoria sp. CS-180]